MPKPVLTLLDFQFPLASSDLGAESLENEYILNNLRLSQIESKIEELASAGEDTTALDDQAFDVEAAQDKCILRLISYCCNGDKLVRATELVKHLSMEKSVKGAIKLVTAMKLPNLAERFSTILEERMMANEANGNEAFTAMKSNEINTSVPSHKTVSYPKTNCKEVGDTKLTSCVFAKKSTLLEDRKPAKGNATQSNTSNPTASSCGNDKANAKPSEAMPSTSNIGNKDHQAKMVENVRPSNPFAKSASTNQKSSSLLESIKKMKGDGNSKR